LRAQVDLQAKEASTKDKSSAKKKPAATEEALNSSFVEKTNAQVQKIVQQLQAIQNSKESKLAGKTHGAAQQDFSSAFKELEQLTADIKSYKTFGSAAQATATAVSKATKKAASGAKKETEALAHGGKAVVGDDWSKYVFPALLAVLLIVGTLIYNSQSESPAAVYRTGGKST